MPEQLSPSASTLVAVDSSNKQHTVINLSVTQRLSEPFIITLTLVSKSFDLQSQLGQKLAVNRYSNNSDNLELSRTFNGIITQIQHLGMDDNLQYSTYKITLRPWFWLLTHTHSFRVYQNLSTSDIVSDIFKNAGFSGSFTVTNLPKTKREYCVQYNESDFDFVSRLLAEEGIHYYHEHSENDHKMILQDAQTPFPQAQHSKLDMVETPSDKYPLITKWMPKTQFHASSVELTSYDYSQSKLVSSKVNKSNHSIANNTKLTQQQYPPLGISGDRKDLASNLVKRRIEQVEQNYQVIIAEAIADSFELGSWFSLNSHLDKSQLGDYSVTAIQADYTTETDCSIKLTLIPKSASHYPSIQSKPIVPGLQSATVAGSTAGDINQDESGRVKIQFHWDTKTSGDKTSAYVRVAQMLAGKGYGSQFVPRAGQEVLVAFINGDPDQPVITGSVYNSQNTPPYAESNSSKSGLKTQLSGQSNEWYFDDKKDNELLYMHAAKDLTQEVENNQTQTIKGELKQTITKKVDVSTEDDYSLAVTKELSQQAKTIKITADDTIELVVGSSKITLSSSSISIEASAIDIKASNGLTLNGTTIESKATSSNKLSGATTAVEATASNSIKGASVAIDAQTTLSAQGQLSAEFKSGLKATFDGGVMGEVKAAIVKVN